MALGMPKSLKVAGVAIGLLAIAVLAMSRSNHTFTGTLTDSMCPTGDHSKMRMGSTDAECTQACVRAGASYVLFDGKATDALSDQKTPEQFAGSKVKVSGTLDPATQLIRVDSITDSNLDSLAAAYLAVAIIFIGYLCSVARRAAHLESEIARLTEK